MRSLAALAALAASSAIALLLTACGGETNGLPGTPPVPEVPSWAKVSEEQVAEAGKHGVPVGFEADLGGGVSMRFVLVPSGSFEMGSPEGEEGRDSDETLHRVTLEQPYYVSIHEVTNAQYRRFRSAHHSKKWDEQNSLDEASQPVVDVGWEDAQAFANWVSQRDGLRTYSLPTEAQWERAARAGRDRSRFYWGDSQEEHPRYANFSDRNDPSFPAREDLDDGHGVTAPVGSYEPNGYGLYDMLGNVWEWCADWYGEYPGAAAPDPRDAASDGRRVLRGGSWLHDPAAVRLADRSRSHPTGANSYFGFRLVAVPPPP